MATFGRNDMQVHPSEVGEHFPVNTHVRFTIHGKPQTGTVTKQLRNSAVVEIDETRENGEFVNMSNGVVVINYKQMKKA